MINPFDFLSFLKFYTSGTPNFEWEKYGNIIKNNN